MAKNRKASPRAESTIDSEQSLGSIPTEQLNSNWRIVGLAILMLHLTAVIAEPFRFFSRSSVQVAPDAELLRNAVRPYSQFLFLDHGYFFFAPNPGPGHLVRILNSSEPVPTLPDDRDITPLQEARKLEGSDSKVILFPDRQAHRPRLLYHRYFMFSEFYFGAFAPPELAAELQNDARILAQWKRDRAIYTSLKDSLHLHGKVQSGLEFSRIDRLERELPDLETTLKDKVRISDIRWLYILPEAFPPPARPLPPPGSEVPRRPRGQELPGELIPPPR